MALNELERKFFKAPKEDECVCPEPPEPVEPELVSLEVSPASISIEEGSTEQLTVTGTYDDSSTEDLTATASYASDDEAVAIVSVSGLVTAILEGDATVTVSVGEVDTTVSVEVTAEV